MRVFKAMSEQGEKKPGIDQKSVGLGWRLGLEFVSGVIVGLGLGYGFDRLFDTNPWGMLVFILLGAAAGFMNVYRLAKAGFGEASQSGEAQHTGEAQQSGESPQDEKET